jgi:hypothetical protein
VTAHEEQRLAALHEYRLLDAPAGDELEAVVRVAARVAGVPAAISAAETPGGGTTVRFSLPAVAP